ncbi:DUF805 domain-containing protein [Rhodovibrio sodomensis]|uniref:DUF805 domain-containing protein n=1 Tax=Rhodovibrio sodomensis TaxID=1088 RepID=UPI0019064671|nr:DUF805 domain-containing protein [Rhodovibrio sodomensis]
MKDLFTPEGRRGRLSYFGWMIGITLVFQFVGAILGGLVEMVQPTDPYAPPRTGVSQGVNAGMALGALIGIWPAFCVAIQRLHDLGHQGAWVLVSFVPVANLFLGLYLLFAPGQVAGNQYGPPPGGNKDVEGIRQSEAGQSRPGKKQPVRGTRNEMSPTDKPGASGKPNPGARDAEPGRDARFEDASDDPPKGQASSPSGETVLGRKLREEREARGEPQQADQARSGEASKEAAASAEPETELGRKLRLEREAKEADRRTADGEGEPQPKPSGGIERDWQGIERYSPSARQARQRVAEQAPRRLDAFMQEAIECEDKDYGRVADEVLARPVTEVEGMPGEYAAEVYLDLQQLDEDLAEELRSRVRRIGPDADVDLLAADILAENWERHDGGPLRNAFVHQDGRLQNLDSYSLVESDAGLSVVRRGDAWRPSDPLHFLVIDAEGRPAMNREYRTDQIAGKALRWMKYQQRSEQKQASG